MLFTKINGINWYKKYVCTHVILYIHYNILSTYFNPREWYGGMGTGLWVWENLVISQRSYFMRRKVIKMVTR